MSSSNQPPKDKAKASPFSVIIYRFTYSEKLIGK